MVVFNSSIRNKLRGMRNSKAEKTDRYLWLFGPTSVGKKSLTATLSSLAKGARPPVAAQLDIGQNDTVVPAVFKLGVGKLSAGERHMAFKDRLRQFRNLYRLDLGVTWLIHGQRIDLVGGLVKGLPKDEADCLLKSTAVFLKLDKDSFEKRQRPGTVKDYQKAYADQDYILSLLCRNFRHVMILHVKDGIQDQYHIEQIFEADGVGFSS